MPTKEEEEAGSSKTSVKAQLQNARLFAQFLKAIQFKDEVTVTINSIGLKLCVEDASKSFQAGAFIQREVFRFFEMSEEEEEHQFQVHLPSIIECLGLFGHQSGTCPVLCLQYSMQEPLKLWLEESGVVVEINARTKFAHDNVDFDFSNTDILCKVIMQAEQLKEILTDMDMSSDSIEVSIDPSVNKFLLSTSGINGKLAIEIPKESEIVSHFTCRDVKPMSARYPMPLFKHALKPLSMAEKVSFRLNGQDILSVQYMVKFEEHKSFLEFYCVPEQQENINED